MRMLATGLLVGCGTISNRVFEEDANFASAFPSTDRTTLGTVPGAESTDPPALLALTLDVHTGVNNFVFGVLDAVDTLRSGAPTSRTDDTRSWGPYDWEGIDLSANSSRTGGLRYDWQLLANGDTFSYGEHYAGDTVASGDGEFVWDYAALAAQTGGTEAGRLLVIYDNRDGVDLLVRVDGYMDGSASRVDADYAYAYELGVGDFEYRAPVVWEETDVNLAVRTRWLDQTGARADAHLETDAGSTVWTQCWNAEGLLLYDADTAGWVVPVGAETACSVHGEGDLERI